MKCLLFWGGSLLLVSRVPLVEETGIQLTVGALQGALAALGQEVYRAGTALHVGGTAVQIVSDCSPHMPFLIFASVVLAFPSSWRRRLLGLVLGAVTIFIFNIIRILALIGILAWRPGWFEFAHIYLWQTGTILVVFVTFAIWIRALSPRLTPTEP